MNVFPNNLRMLSRLVPKKGNIRYLAASAVLSRLVTGGVRVAQNLPVRNHNPDMTKAEKYSSAMERLFVEIFGTVLYMGSIHLGMDVFAHIAQKNLKLPDFGDPDFKKNELYTLDPSPSGRTPFEASKKTYGEIVQVVRDTFRDYYGGEQGILARTIFGNENGHRIDFYGFMDVVDKNLRKKSKGQMTLRKLRKNKEVSKHLFNALEQYFARVNHVCSATWGVGIIIGALFGGFGIQFINDRIISSKVIPLINKLIGLSPPQPFADAMGPANLAANRSTYASDTYAVNTTDAQRTFRV